jgi:heat shock protein HslJ
MRALAISAALFLVACMPEGESGGGSATPPALSAAAGELWNTAWVADTVEGKPIVPTGAITLTFGNGQAGGSSGCNSYSGGVTAKDGAIKIGLLASTMIACSEEGRMQQEAAYTRLLRDAVRYERPSTTQLTIFAADGRAAAFTAKR